MQGAGYPTNAREGRLWNFFNSGEDFFSIKDWPVYLREMALKEHKNHRERYRLYLFLTANGLHPDVACSWVSAKDAKHSQLVEGDYDRPAYSQLADMSKKAFSGDLFLSCSFFDMISGRVIERRPFQ